MWLRRRLGWGDWTHFRPFWHQGLIVDYHRFLRGHGAQGVVGTRDAAGVLGVPRTEGAIKGDGVRPVGLYVGLELERGLETGLGLVQREG
jgi:hypothetical protein